MTSKFNHNYLIYKMLKLGIVFSLTISIGLDSTGLSWQDRALAQTLASPSSAKLQNLPSACPIQDLILSQMRKDKIFKADSGLQLILIRDLHAEEEAQLKISRSIQKIYEQAKISKVFIEGAEGPVRTLLYQAFPDENVRRKVGRAFVKEGYLTGAELSAIELGLGAGIELYGAEDAKLYVSNLKAFRQTRRQFQAVQEEIKTFQGSLRSLKMNHFSEELKTLDHLRQEWKGGAGDLEKLVITAGRLLEKIGRTFDPWKNVVKLNEIMKENVLLKQEDVQKELSSLMEMFQKGLNSEEMKEVVRKTFEYRLGRLSASGYIMELKRVYQEQVLSSESFENKFSKLESWLKIVQKQEALNFDEVSSEFQNLLDVLTKEYASRENVTDIFEVDEKWQLIEKLIQLELTRSDFEKLKTWDINKEWVSLCDQIKALQKKRSDPMPSPQNPEKFFDLLKSAMAFYTFAQQRDEILVRKTLEHLSQPHDAAILITGGFHTEGIQKILEKESISYVTWTPEVKEAMSESPYEKIMMDESYDLDQGEFSNKRLVLRDKNEAVRKMLGVPVLDGKILEALSRGRYEEISGLVLEMMMDEGIGVSERLGSINKILNDWFYPQMERSEERRMVSAAEKKFPREVFLKLSELDPANRWQRTLAVRIVQSAFGKEYPGLVALTESLLRKRSNDARLVLATAQKVMRQAELSLAGGRFKEAQEKWVEAAKILAEFIVIHPQHQKAGSLFKEIIENLTSDQMASLGQERFEMARRLLMDVKKMASSIPWVAEAIQKMDLLLIHAQGTIETLPGHAHTDAVRIAASAGTPPSSISARRSGADPGSLYRLWQNPLKRRLVILGLALGALPVVLVLAKFIVAHIIISCVMAMGMTAVSIWLRRLGVSRGAVAVLWISLIAMLSYIKIFASVLGLLPFAKLVDMDALSNRLIEREPYTAGRMCVSALALSQRAQDGFFKAMKRLSLESAQGQNLMRDFRAAVMNLRNPSLRDALLKRYYDFAMESSLGNADPSLLLSLSLQYLGQAIDDSVENVPHYLALMVRRDFIFEPPSVEMILFYERARFLADPVLRKNLLASYYGYTIRFCLNQDSVNMTQVMDYAQSALDEVGVQGRTGDSVLAVIAKAGLATPQGNDLVVAFIEKARALPDQKRKMDLLAGCYGHVIQFVLDQPSPNITLAVRYAREALDETGAESEIVKKVLGVIAKVGIATPEGTDLMYTLMQKIRIVTDVKQKSQMLNLCYRDAMKFALNENQMELALSYANEAIREVGVTNLGGDILRFVRRVGLDKFECITVMEKFRVCALAITDPELKKRVLTAYYRFSIHTALALPQESSLVNSYVRQAVLDGAQEAIFEIISTYAKFLDEVRARKINSRSMLTEDFQQGMVYRELRATLSRVDHLLTVFLRPDAMLWGSSQESVLESTNENYRRLKTIADQVRGDQKNLDDEALNWLIQKSEQGLAAPMTSIGYAQSRDLKFFTKLFDLSSSDLPLRKKAGGVIVGLIETLSEKAERLSDSWTSGNLREAQALFDVADRCVEDFEAHYQGDEIPEDAFEEPDRSQIWSELKDRGYVDSDRRLTSSFMFLDESSFGLPDALKTREVEIYSILQRYRGPLPENWASMTAKVRARKFSLYLYKLYQNPDDLDALQKVNNCLNRPDLSKEEKRKILAALEEFDRNAARVANPGQFRKLMTLVGTIADHFYTNESQLESPDEALVGETLSLIRGSRMRVTARLPLSQLLTDPQDQTALATVQGILKRRDLTLSERRSILTELRNFTSSIAQISNLALFDAAEILARRFAGEFVALLSVGGVTVLDRGVAALMEGLTTLAPSRTFVRRTVVEGLAYVREVSAFVTANASRGDLTRDRRRWSRTAQGLLAVFDHVQALQAEIEALPESPELFNSVLDAMYWSLNALSALRDESLFQTRFEALKNFAQFLEERLGSMAPSSVRNLKDRLRAYQRILESGRHLRAYKTTADKVEKVTHLQDALEAMGGAPIYLTEVRNQVFRIVDLLLRTRNQRTVIAQDNRDVCEKAKVLLNRVKGNGFRERISVIDQLLSKIEDKNAPVIEPDEYRPSGPPPVPGAVSGGAVAARPVPPPVPSIASGPRVAPTTASGTSGAAASVGAAAARPGLPPAPGAASSGASTARRGPPPAPAGASRAISVVDWNEKLSRVENALDQVTDAQSLIALMSLYQGSDAPLAALMSETLSEDERNDLPPLADRLFTKLEEAMNSVDSSDLDQVERLLTVGFGLIHAFLNVCPVQNPALEPILRSRALALLNARASVLLSSLEERARALTETDWLQAQAIYQRVHSLYGVINPCLPSDGSIRSDEFERVDLLSRYPVLGTGRADPAQLVSSDEGSPYEVSGLFLREVLSVLSTDRTSGWVSPRFSETFDNGLEFLILHVRLLAEQGHFDQALKDYADVNRLLERYLAVPNMTGADREPVLQARRELLADLSAMEFSESQSLWAAGNFSESRRHLAHVERSDSSDFAHLFTGVSDAEGTQPARDARAAILKTEKDAGVFLVEEFRGALRRGRRTVKALKKAFSEGRFEDADILLRDLKEDEIVRGILEDLDVQHLIPASKDTLRVRAREFLDAVERIKNAKPEFERDFKKIGDIETLVISKHFNEARTALSLRNKFSDFFSSEEALYAKVLENSLNSLEQIRNASAESDAADYSQTVFDGAARLGLSNGPWKDRLEKCVKHMALPGRVERAVTALTAGGSLAQDEAREIDRLLKEQIALCPGDAGLAEKASDFQQAVIESYGRGIRIAFERATRDLPEAARLISFLKELYGENDSITSYERRVEVLNKLQAGFPTLPPGIQAQVEEKVEGEETQLWILQALAKWLEGRNYEVKEVIKGGLEGFIFRVRNRDTGSEQALKIGVRSTDLNQDLFSSKYEFFLKPFFESLPDGGAGRHFIKILEAGNDDVDGMFFEWQIQPYVSGIAGLIPQREMGAAYRPGTSLSARTYEMNARRQVQVVSQMADALESLANYDGGIVHGDMHGDNYQIADDDTVMLLDFGGAVQNQENRVYAEAVVYLDDLISLLPRGMSVADQAGLKTRIVNAARAGKLRNISLVGAPGWRPALQGFFWISKDEVIERNEQGTAILSFNEEADGSIQVTPKTRRLAAAEKVSPNMDVQDSVRVMLEILTGKVMPLLSHLPDETIFADAREKGNARREKQEMIDDIFNRWETNYNRENPTHPLSDADKAEAKVLAGELLDHIFDLYYGRKTIAEFRIAISGIQGHANTLLLKSAQPLEAVTQACARLDAEVSSENVEQVRALLGQSDFGISDLKAVLDCLEGVVGNLAALSADLYPPIYTSLQAIAVTLSDEVWLRAHGVDVSSELANRAKGFKIFLWKTGVNRSVASFRRSQDLKDLEPAVQALEEYPYKQSREFLGAVEEIADLLIQNGAKCVTQDTSDALYRRVYDLFAQAAPRGVVSNLAVRNQQRRETLGIMFSTEFVNVAKLLQKVNFGIADHRIADLESLQELYTQENSPLKILERTASNDQVRGSVMSSLSLLWASRFVEISNAAAASYSDADDLNAVYGLCQTALDLTSAFIERYGAGLQGSRQIESLRAWAAGELWGGVKHFADQLSARARAIQTAGGPGAEGHAQDLHQKAFKLYQKANALLPDANKIDADVILALEREVREEVTEEFGWSQIEANLLSMSCALSRDQRIQILSWLMVWLAKDEQAGYEVQKILGAGKKGVVFLISRPRPSGGRESLALKVSLIEDGEEPVKEKYTRFLKAFFDHPDLPRTHFARVLDAGHEPGEPIEWSIQEFVPNLMGPLVDTSALERAGPGVFQNGHSYQGYSVAYDLHPDEQVDVIRQMGAILKCMEGSQDPGHERPGIVHGDFHEVNLMLQGDPAAAGKTVVLIDPDNAVENDADHVWVTAFVLLLNSRLGAGHEARLKNAIVSGMSIEGGCVVGDVLVGQFQIPRDRMLGRNRQGLPMTVSYDVRANKTYLKPVLRPKAAGEKVQPNMDVQAGARLMLQLLTGRVIDVAAFFKEGRGLQTEQIRQVLEHWSNGNPSSLTNEVQGRATDLVGAIYDLYEGKLTLSEFQARLNEIAPTLSLTATGRRDIPGGDDPDLPAPVPPPSPAAAAHQGAPPLPPRAGPPALPPGSSASVDEEGEDYDGPIVVLPPPLPRAHKAFAQPPALPSSPRSPASGPAAAGPLRASVRAPTLSSPAMRLKAGDIFLSETNVRRVAVRIDGDNVYFIATDGSVNYLERLTTQEIRDFRDVNHLRAISGELADQEHVTHALKPGNVFTRGDEHLVLISESSQVLFLRIRGDLSDLTALASAEIEMGLTIADVLGPDWHYENGTDENRALAGDVSRTVERLQAQGVTVNDGTLWPLLQKQLLGLDFSNYRSGNVLKTGPHESRYLFIRIDGDEVILYDLIEHRFVNFKKDRVIADIKDGTLRYDPEDPDGISSKDWVDWIGNLLESIDSLPAANISAPTQRNLGQDETVIIDPDQLTGQFITLTIPSSDPAKPQHCSLMYDARVDQVVVYPWGRRQSRLMGKGSWAEYNGSYFKNHLTVFRDLKGRLIVRALSGDVTLKVQPGKSNTLNMRREETLDTKGNQQAYAAQAARHHFQRIDDFSFGDFFENGAVLGLFDGMGGYASGDIASRVASIVIRAHMKNVLTLLSPDQLTRPIIEANLKIAIGLADAVVNDLRRVQLADAPDGVSVDATHVYRLLAARLKNTTLDPVQNPQGVKNIADVVIEAIQFARAQGDAEDAKPFEGMGTTAVVSAIFQNQKGEQDTVTANVGDSRAYRVYNNAGRVELERLTEDDSLIKDFADVWLMQGVVSSDERKAILLDPSHAADVFSAFGPGLATAAHFTQDDINHLTYTWEARGAITETQAETVRSDRSSLQAKTIFNQVRSWQFRKIAFALIIRDTDNHLLMDLMGRLNDDALKRVLLNCSVSEADIAVILADRMTSAQLLMQYIARQTGPEAFFLSIRQSLIDVYYDEFGDDDAALEEAGMDGKGLGERVSEIDRSQGNVVVRAIGSGQFSKGRQTPSFSYPSQKSEGRRIHISDGVSKNCSDERLRELVQTQLDEGVPFGDIPIERLWVQDARDEADRRQKGDDDITGHGMRMPVMLAQVKPVARPAAVAAPAPSFGLLQAVPGHSSRASAVPIVSSSSAPPIDLAAASAGAHPATHAPPSHEFKPDFMGSLQPYFEKARALGTFFLGYLKEHQRTIAISLGSISVVSLLTFISASGAATPLFGFLETLEKEVWWSGGIASILTFAGTLIAMTIPKIKKDGGFIFAVVTAFVGLAIAIYVIIFGFEQLLNLNISAISPSDAPSTLCSAIVSPLFLFFKPQIGREESSSFWADRIQKIHSTVSAFASQRWIRKVLKSLIIILPALIFVIPRTAFADPGNLLLEIAQAATSSPFMGLVCVASVLISVLVSFLALLVSYRAVQRANSRDEESLIKTEREAMQTAPISGSPVTLEIRNTVPNSPTLVRLSPRGGSIHDGTANRTRAEKVRALVERAQTYMIEYWKKCRGNAPLFVTRYGDAEDVRLENGISVESDEWKTPSDLVCLVRRRDALIRGEGSDTAGEYISVLESDNQEIYGYHIRMHPFVEKFPALLKLYLHHEQAHAELFIRRQVLVAKVQRESRKLEGKRFRGLIDFLIRTPLRFLATFLYQDTSMLVCLKERLDLLRAVQSNTPFEDVAIYYEDFRLFLSLDSGERDEIVNGLNHFSRLHPTPINQAFARIYGELRDQAKLDVTLLARMQGDDQEILNWLMQAALRLAEASDITFKDRFTSYQRELSFYKRTLLEYAFLVRDVVVNREMDEKERADQKSRFWEANAVIRIVNARAGEAGQAQLLPAPEPVENFETRGSHPPGSSRSGRHFAAQHGGGVDQGVGQEAVVSHDHTNQEVQSGMTQLEILGVQVERKLENGPTIVSDDSALVENLAQFVSASGPLPEWTRKTLKGVRIALLPDKNSGREKLISVAENSEGSVYAHYGQAGKDKKSQTPSVFIRAEFVRRLLKLKEGPQVLATLLTLEMNRHVYLESGKEDSRSSAQVVKDAGIARDQLETLLNAIAEIEADIFLENPDNTQVIMGASEVLERGDPDAIVANTYLGKFRGRVVNALVRKLADRMASQEDRRLEEAKKAIHKIETTRASTESSVLVKALIEELGSITNAQTIGIDLLMGEVHILSADGRIHPIKLSRDVSRTLSLMIGKLAGNVDKVVIDLPRSDQRTNFLEQTIKSLVNPDQKALEKNGGRNLGSVCVRSLQIGEQTVIYLGTSPGRIQKMTTQIAKAVQFFNIEARKNENHPVLVEAKLLQDKLASLKGSERDVFLKICQKQYAVIRGQKIDRLSDVVQEALWKNYDAFTKLPANFRVVILSSQGKCADEMKDAMILKFNSEQQNQPNALTQVMNFASYIAHVGKEAAGQDFHAAEMFKILLQALYNGRDEEAEAILGKMSLSEILSKPEFIFPPIKTHFSEDLDSFMRAKRTVEAMA